MQKTYDWNIGRFICWLSVSFLCLSVGCGGIGGGPEVGSETTKAPLAVGADGTVNIGPRKIIGREACRGGSGYVPPPQCAPTLGHLASYDIDIHSVSVAPEGVVSVVEKSTDTFGEVRVRAQEAGEAEVRIQGKATAADGSTSFDETVEVEVHRPDRIQIEAEPACPRKQGASNDGPRYALESYAEVLAKPMADGEPLQAGAIRNRDNAPSYSPLAFPSDSSLEVETEIEQPWPDDGEKPPPYVVYLPQFLGDVDHLEVDSATRDQPVPLYFVGSDDVEEFELERLSPDTNDRTGLPMRVETIVEGDRLECAPRVEVISQTPEVCAPEGYEQTTVSSTEDGFNLVRKQRGTCQLEMTPRSGEESAVSTERTLEIQEVDETSQEP